MATISECRAAVDRLADQLARNADARGKVDLDRSLSLEITDLGTGFHGRLTDGRLVGITDGTDSNAKVRLSARSDDLIALVDGALPFAQAWASGQVSVKASVFDLMKLRKLL
ncbi:MAG: alkyl sulfatase C-terminal domain-containing protein [Micromonosporaceae bacterium]